MAGYVFGALQPVNGEVFTLTCERRTPVNWVDFLSAVEAWINPAAERVYAVLDNLNIHSAPDMLLADGRLPDRATRSAARVSSSGSGGPTGSRPAAA